MRAHTCVHMRGGDMFWDSGHTSRDGHKVVLMVCSTVV